MQVATRTIKKIESKTERQIDRIIARESRSYPLFLRKIPKPEIKLLKQKVREIVEAYPPKVRPFVMTWLIVAYFSIIPMAGTSSLLFWGALGKYLQKKKKQKEQER